MPIYSRQLMGYVDGMTLTEVQQHLLNHFNLVQVCSLESTIEVLEEILNKLGSDKSPEQKELLQHIAAINKTIKKYDLEIVESIDEITCVKLFILINTADNNASQKSKFYDKNSTQFFSKIVRDCVLSEEGHVSETHCLNVSSEVGMTKTAAQSVLEKFVRHKWLESKNGRVSLAMRSIAELEQNIKQLYPDDVNYCLFCKLIIIQGYTCKNCKSKCHYACLKKYYTHTKSNCVCSKCKEVWDDIPLQLKVTEETEGTKSKSVEDLSVSNVVPTKKRRKNYLIED